MHSTAVLNNNPCIICHAAVSKDIVAVEACKSAMALPSWWKLRHSAAHVPPILLLPLEPSHDSHHGMQFCLLDSCTTAPTPIVPPPAFLHCDRRRGELTADLLSSLADDSWQLLDLAGCSKLFGAELLAAAAKMPKLAALDATGAQLQELHDKAAIGMQLPVLPANPQHQLGICLCGTYHLGFLSVRHGAAAGLATLAQLCSCCRTGSCVAVQYSLDAWLAKKVPADFLLWNLSNILCNTMFVRTRVPLYLLIQILHFLI
jgi:hypothetical protein